MASCLIPDSPAVMVALEHLRELDKQLKEEGLSFTSEASNNLREIMAAITELEATRRAVHEQLEVETIENSKLRHQIHSMREQISQEIMADVAAARQSNAEEIEQLHKDISSISQLQEAMVKRQEALSRQNAELFPEREQLKAEHENNTVALSCQFSEKYNLQIQLKQTLQDIEELKTCIAATEQSKITLQQNMIQEREAFTVTTDGVLKEVEGAIKKIQQQRQKNGTNRRVLDRVNDEERDKHDHLSELRNRMTQLESNIGRLAAFQCQYENQLKEDIQTQAKLSHQRETLEKELRELTESFDAATQRLKEVIVLVDCEMEEIRAAGSVLQDSLAKVSERFRSQHKEENEAKADHLSVYRRLERSKLRLEERIASIVKHRMEMSEMGEHISQLQETDAINKDVFQRDFEGLQGQLDTERRNISQFEEEKERLCRNLEEAKKEQEEHVAKVSSDIGDTRRRYQELRQEEVALQQHQGMSREIDSLMCLVSQAEIDYRQIERAHRQEMHQIASESEQVVRSSEEKEMEVKGKEEVLKEVEAQFDKEQSTQQRLEKLTCELKCRKNQLEMSIQELKENTRSLLQPKEEMQAELEAMRARYLDQLDGQASELTSAERSIYDNGVKLEQVNMENSRLHLCIAQMKKEVASARQDKDRYMQEIHCLREEVSALHECLVEAWREDLLFTQDCQGNDSAVLGSMGFLLKHVQTRSLQLENVSTHLNQELSCISKLLYNKTQL